MKDEIIIPIETTYRIKDQKFLIEYIAQKLNVTTFETGYGANPSRNGDTYSLNASGFGVRISVSPADLTVFSCKEGNAIFTIDVKDMQGMTFEMIVGKIHGAINTAGIISFCIDQSKCFASMYKRYVHIWAEEVYKSGTQTRTLLTFEEWMRNEVEEEEV